MEIIEYEQSLEFAVSQFGFEVLLNHDLGESFIFY